MTRQLHAQAVLDRLTAQPALAGKVHDGRVRDNAVPPYVLVRFDFRRPTASERPDASDLTFSSLAFMVAATVVSVGGGSDDDLAARAARAVANQVEVALLGWSPSVAGRSCGPVKQTSSFGSPADEESGVTYVELSDEYEFYSQPA